MKIIQKLSDRISDEIKDAKDYALMALEIKDEYPDVARVLYTISMQEMEHMRMLHDCVTTVIQKFRTEKGEPPEKMLAIYDYLHEKQIEEAANTKIIQAMYK